MEKTVNKTRSHHHVLMHLDCDRIDISIDLLTFKNLYLSCLAHQSMSEEFKRFVKDFSWCYKHLPNVF